MIITVISDTHTQHLYLTRDKTALPGGELLIHAGDIMNSGNNSKDVTEFCKWFDGLDQYNNKIFIAGNHDRMFETRPEAAMEIVNSYKSIDYLQDTQLTLYYDGPNGEFPQDNIRIYGSPWQPEFYNWAFNLPKGGKELQEKWAAIPLSTDILITHGPAQGHLDASGPPYNEPNLGCGLLRHHFDTVFRPKIHVCGHIHGGYGYKFDGQTHFFNASVLNEQYEYVNKPMTFDWNPDTNEIEFLNY
jgi:Icc-related predicted phosphoesterase